MKKASKFFVDVGLTLTVCGALLGALGIVVYVGLTVLHNVYGGL